MPYGGRDLARNHWFLGLACLGDGWHAHHHRFPWSARHGLEPGQWDASWMVIRALRALGLARNVRVPSAEQILAARAAVPRSRVGSRSQPRQPDDFIAELGTLTHDRRDPDQWWALYTDRSLPLDPQVKAALVLDARSFSRRVLLPLLRPLARAALILVGLFRILVPRALTSSRAAAPPHLPGAAPLRQPAGELPHPAPLPPRIERGRLPGRELGHQRRDAPAAAAGPRRREGAPVPAARPEPLQLHHQPERGAGRRRPRPDAPRARRLRRHRRAPDPVRAVPARPVQLPGLDLGDRALHAAVSPAAGAARLRAREPVAAARRDRRHLRGPGAGRHDPPGAGQQPPPVGAAVVAARRATGWCCTGWAPRCCTPCWCSTSAPPPAARSRRAASGFGLQSLWRRQQGA